MTKEELLDKIDEIYSGSKLSEIEALNKALAYVGIRKEAEEEKKASPLVWIFAILGVVVAVAGIAYLVYRYFEPDYLEDFDDDFDDEDEDEFFEDEDADPEEE